VVAIINYADYNPRCVKAKNQRNIAVQNQDDAYLSLKLFLGLAHHKRLFVPTALTFHGCTRDQGWSSFPEQQGTRQGSHTWIEGCVVSVGGERARVELLRNLHAGQGWEKWTVVMDRNSSLLKATELAERTCLTKGSNSSSPMSVLVEMRLRSQYPGWCCNCSEARIEINFEMKDYEMLLEGTSEQL